MTLVWMAVITVIAAAASSFGCSSNYDYSSLLDNGCPEITVITVFEVETEQRPMFILQPQIFCALLRPVARPHRLAVCPIFGPLQNSEARHMHADNGATNFVIAIRLTYLVFRSNTSSIYQPLSCGYTDTIFVLSDQVVGSENGRRP